MRPQWTRQPIYNDYRLSVALDAYPDPLFLCAFGLTLACFTHVWRRLVCSSSFHVSPCTKKQSKHQPLVLCHLKPRRHFCVSVAVFICSAVREKYLLTHDYSIAGSLHPADSAIMILYHYGRTLQSMLYENAVLQLQTGCCCGQLANVSISAKSCCVKGTFLGIWVYVCLYVTFIFFQYNTVSSRVSSSSGCGFGTC